MMFDYGKIVFDGPREMMSNPSHEFVSQFLGFSGDGADADLVRKRYAVQATA
jgi:ABC-type proline/glycine betaine transport system ATPase subunit